MIADSYSLWVHLACPVKNNERLIITLSFAEMFISLASIKIMFFIAVAHVLSLLLKLSFHLPIIEKVKNSIYCYLVADILTKVLQKWLFDASGS